MANDKTRGRETLEQVALRKACAEADIAEENALHARTHRTGRTVGDGIAEAAPWLFISVVLLSEGLAFLIERFS